MKTHQSDKPLVSVCMLCYNQEKYIGDAFRAALAQDYSPLEIVVSDDCSTDNSFSIVQSIANEYDGPHKIILHRNEKNKGMILNWLTLCELANGILMFKADGDDISLPNRVSTITQDWITSGKKSVLISHSYDRIDLDGNFLDKIIQPFTGDDTRKMQEIYCGKGYVLWGATSAYHKSLYNNFPSEALSEAADDTTFVGRAIMTGPCRILSKSLVKYRVGSGETSVGKNFRRSMSRGLSLAAEANKQNLLDLEHIKNTLTSAQYKEYYEIFSSRLEHHQTVLKLYQGKSFSERLNGYKGTYKGPVFSKSWLVCVILLLPEKLGDWIFKLIQKIQKLCC